MPSPEHGLESDSGSRCPPYQSATCPLRRIANWYLAHPMLKYPLRDSRDWVSHFSVHGVMGSLAFAGAMRQRKLGSHTPPCHRRMVITTMFRVILAALQLRPVLYHTRWLLIVPCLWSSGH